EGGAAAFVSAQAVALARGAFRAMLLNKLLIAGTVLLAMALLGTGATALLKAASQVRPAAQAVQEPLPEARPDRAGVGGKPLPRGVLARMGTTQLRHGDAVYFAAYTPDGKRLVTAGRDRTLRLWDLATGTEVRRFEWRNGQPHRQPDPASDGTLRKFEQQVWDDLA